jgi:hypothetical protein
VTWPSSTIRCSVSASFDLSLMRQRIDDGADVVRANHAPQPHLSGVAVDLDFGDLRGERRHLSMSAWRICSRSSDWRFFQLLGPRH